MIVPKETQSPAAVAAHYDELDPFYREIWGRHVHHGYWTTGRETPEEATDALVELVARELRVEKGDRVCDIGCGYGAAAAHLARVHDVSVTGLTLSRVQAGHAAQLAQADGRLTFACRDWMVNELPEGAFDAAYAIESSEHMADKARFFAEALRVLRPGGRLCVCAWLAREAASPWEMRHLLEPICREGRMSGMGTEGEYRALAAGAGFVVEGFADISRDVRRTWTICARRVLAKVASDPAYRRFLLSRESQNRVFAVTLARLVAAYRTGAMRYGVFTLVKPVA
ncbi:class I SAM-dependent methyltransferase [Salinarimonas soli]|uniref:Methyltransferase domain-containing protein n=1 Tax=Salinarimonas soli TaxID=1638099 RepID=A0A5B2VZJ0_9HYPH|nr:class I SAM-dependent methyltransferase [Salinarimonas soli]KAA2244088.1 methyltransferase domain-containing protein [Salinarimonas soli]